MKYNTTIPSSAPVGKVVFIGRHHPDSQEIQALG